MNLMKPLKNVATKLDGGDGGKTLVAGSLKTLHFCGFPYMAGKIYTFSQMNSNVNIYTLVLIHLPSPRASYKGSLSEFQFC